MLINLSIYFHATQLFCFGSTCNCRGPFCDMSIYLLPHTGDSTDSQLTSAPEGSAKGAAHTAKRPREILPGGAGSGLPASFLPTRGPPAPLWSLLSPSTWRRARRPQAPGRGARPCAPLSLLLAGRPTHCHPAARGDPSPLPSSRQGRAGQGGVGRKLAAQKGDAADYPAEELRWRLTFLSAPAMARPGWAGLRCAARRGTELPLPPPAAEQLRACAPRRRGPADAR